MLKYTYNYLKMYEMSLKIVRYGPQSSEKLDTSKSDEKSRKTKVVPMGSPGGQNVPTPRESILTLSRGSQLQYTAKKVFAYFLQFPRTLVRDSDSGARA